jgi:hypothetical protein
VLTSPVPIPVPIFYPAARLAAARQPNAGHPISPTMRMLTVTEVAKTLERARAAALPGREAAVCNAVWCELGEVLREPLRRQATAPLRLVSPPAGRRR